jgi:hypothetical protein
MIRDYDRKISWERGEEFLRLVTVPQIPAARRAASALDPLDQVS